MATWQFDIDLLPRKQLLTLFGDVPSILNEGLLDTAAKWREQRLPTDCESRISKILPEDRSWSPQIRMWGEENGNRISLVYDDAGNRDAISVRIDVRNPNTQFFEDIVEFANSIDAVFLVIEDFQILDPGVDSLVMRMNQSNAYRFVEDPNEFLESIRTGKTNFRGVP
jgi:hypothetical protein